MPGVKGGLFGSETGHYYARTQEARFHRETAPPYSAYLSRIFGTLATCRNALRTLEGKCASGERMCKRGRSAAGSMSHPSINHAACRRKQAPARPCQIGAIGRRLQSVHTRFARRIALRAVSASARRLGRTLGVRTTCGEGYKEDGARLQTLSVLSHSSESRLPSSRAMRLSAHSVPRVATHT